MARSERNADPIEAQINEQYAAAVQAAKDIRDERLRAYRLMKELGVTITLAKQEKSAEVAHFALSPPPAGGRMTLRAIVHEFVGNAGSINFTVNDITDWSEVKYPGILTPKRRAGVSSALIGLSQDGVLDVVERGTGSKPTIYRRAHGSTEERAAA